MRVSVPDSAEAASSSRAGYVVFDGDQFSLMDSNRISLPGNNGAHGLGCTFSSALACGLARGFALIQAVDDAKRYVMASLEGSFRAGRGSLLLDHGVDRHRPPR